MPDDAPVAFAGTAPDGPGFWFPPTVLAPVAADAPAFSEEIFGPVRGRRTVRGRGRRHPDRQRHAVRPVRLDLDRDVGRAFRVARAVETGNLSVNSHSSVRYWTPFGGFKQSGLGRELGPDALDAFTEVKNVFIATD